jgi:hypothetical protein
MLVLSVKDSEVAVIVTEFWQDASIIMADCQGGLWPELRKSLPGENPRCSIAAWK